MPYGANYESSVAKHKRRKKRVLKKSQGAIWTSQQTLYSTSQTSLLYKGMAYSYRDLKVKKREFKRLWIIRINAACQSSGITYSRFIKGLNDANIDINRKLLAELAIYSPEAFQEFVNVAKDKNSSIPKG